MREYKVIVFEDPEIVLALAGLRRRQGKPIPPGSVTKVEVTRKGDVGVDLHIELDDGRPVVESFNAAELAAGFVAVLIDRKVPLPASAPKTATLIDGRWVALLVHPLQDGKVSGARGSRARAS
jgi:hypothetical protein